MKINEDVMEEAETDRVIVMTIMKLQMYFTGHIRRATRKKKKEKRTGCWSRKKYMDEIIELTTEKIGVSWLPMF